jgi:MFS family permease
MIVPLYQAEICHPKIRGRVTALQQFMLGVGALCAAWISYGTYVGFDPTNNAQWQVPLGLQIAPAVILGLLIMFFPEVIRWNIFLTECDADTRTVTSLAHRPWLQRKGLGDPCKTPCSW